VLPERPAWRGSGRPPQARYRRPPGSLRSLALAVGSAATREVVWREGSRGPMAARFPALRVRPANGGLRRAHPEGLPLVRRLAWLLCQWPAAAAEPAKYWLANLPAETTLRRDHTQRSIASTQTPQERGPGEPDATPPE